MTVCLWKRFSLLLLLALTIVSFGCSKKVAPAPPPPPPPPPAPAPPPAPTITLNVDRASITPGQSAVLSYVATNATAVTINPGVGAVPGLTGTRQVTPTQTTSFTARATGPGGSADSAAVNVVVNAPPPPPPVVPPPPKPAPAAPNKTLDQLFTETMVPILFDYDKATIRPGEESKLLNNAAWLKQNPTVKFQIEGHADERGSQEYNIALGDERAAAVQKFLAGQGIAESRMSKISYGEERPICHEQTEDCFQKNRRAAFVRTP